MANTLTDLAADIYKAADSTWSALDSSCPLPFADSSMAVAKGDVVRSHFTRSVSVSSSYAPSMAIPEGTDQDRRNRRLPGSVCHRSDPVDWRRHEVCEQRLRLPPPSWVIRFPVPCEQSPTPSRRTFASLLGYAALLALQAPHHLHPTRRYC